MFPCLFSFPIFDILLTGHGCTFLLCICKRESHICSSSSCTYPCFCHIQSCSICAQTCAACRVNSDDRVHERWLTIDCVLSPICSSFFSCICLCFLCMHVLCSPHSSLFAIWEATVCSMMFALSSFLTCSFQVEAAHLYSSSARQHHTSVCIHHMSWPAFINPCPVLSMHKLTLHIELTQRRESMFIT